MSIDQIHQLGLQQSDLNAVQQVLNGFQHAFPLTPTPYADMAEKLGMDEQNLLDLLAMLQDKGIISRIGAVFRPNRVGVSTLAAMAVPEDQLERIADIISNYSSVNHNYEREHHFNLWFVATAETHDQLNNILADMEQKCGIRILSLPMEKDYHIDLGFPLQLIQGGGHD